MFVGVGVVVALVFGVVTQHQANQQLKTQNSASLWRSVETLNLWWVDDPDNRLFFYGDRPAPRPASPELNAISESFLDVFERVFYEWEAAGHNPLGWEAWMNDLLVSSQVLREFIAKNRHWYEVPYRCTDDPASGICLVDLNSDGYACASPDNVEEHRDVVIAPNITLTECDPPTEMVFK